MAPSRSVSLRKLTTLLFEDSAGACDEEEADGQDECLKVSCHFERTLSEDSTVLGQPFSRNISPGGSDDEAEPAVVHSHLEATPEAAKLLKGKLADPGPEVHHGQELIAVRPSGEASYVKEDEMAELEVMRTLLDGDASPLILVGRDGTAFYAPDGDNVDWDRLQALCSRSREETTVSPPPSPSSGAGAQPRSAPPLCPAARSLAPPQGDEGEDDFEGEAAMASFMARRPEASVPRSPSLKRLSALLFAPGAGAAGGWRAACAEPEELVMEPPEAPKAAAVGRPHPQGARRLWSQWSQGCWQQ